MAPATAAATGASAVRLALAAMGTRFEVALHGEDPVRLRAAGEAALAAIDECHRRLTRFSEDSLIAHIRREAADRPVPLDTDTWELFAEALDVRDRSGGAFDITVSETGPAGPSAIRLDAPGRTIRLAVPRVPLDLGAIAKGHALDLAARELRAAGIDAALLHGGTSSVVAIGAPPAATAWTIAVARAAGLGPVRLRDAALSVSSAGGGRGDGAHLRDGRTGAAAAPRRAAVVIGPSARGADAWATALAVLGRRPADLGPEWTVHLFDLDAG